MNEIQIPHALRPYVPSEKDYVRGVSSQIVFQSRVPSGDWTQYLPTYEPQKYFFDTNDCWCLSGINSVDTQLNFLNQSGAFTEAQMTWFKTNGYIDSSGSFATSERFIEILSGVQGNGNSEWVFWQLASTNGLIPRSMLEYTLTQADNFSTQEAFYADYFNPAAITPAMTALGKEFLTYVNLAYEWVQSDPNSPVNAATLAECLQQAPQQIGTPVCIPGWNQIDVPVCPSIEIVHATLCYKYDGTYHIRDQYQPDNKDLAVGYMVTLVVNGVVTAVPVAPQPSVPVPAAPTVALQKIGIIKELILDLEEEIGLIQNKNAN